MGFWRHWRWTDWGALALTVAALVIYVWARTRYIGGCDSASYLLESYRLRGIDAGLSLDAALPFGEIWAPQCMVVRGGEVTTFFLPGYPILLALSGLVGLEFHLNPILGAASVALLYRLVAKRSGPEIGLAAAALWLTNPNIVASATQVTSDFPSAAALLLAFVVASGGRPLTAGFLVGFAAGIRPANLLFLPVAFLIDRRRAPALRVAAGFALAVVAWGVFQLLTYGDLRPAYLDNAAILELDNWAGQVAALTRLTLAIHWPIIVLAVAGAAMRPRANAPLVLWVLLFYAFHGAWPIPFRSWYVRFLIPAFPALFILAADGAAAILERARSPLSSRPTLRRALLALAVLGLIGLGLRGALSTPTRRALNTGKFEQYFSDSRTAAERLPENALVGAGAYAGPARLYGGLTSFLWGHPHTDRLIRWTERHRRPVFTLLTGFERDNGPHPPWLTEEFVRAPLEQLPGGAWLERIDPLPGRISIHGNDDRGRAPLGPGWTVAERDGREAKLLVSAAGASLALPLAPDRDHCLRFSGRALPPINPPLQVELLSAGESLGRRSLEGHRSRDRLRLRAGVNGEVVLRFGDHAAGTDEATPIAAFDWLTVAPTDEEGCAER